jgi:hypothetical protein
MQSAGGAVSRTRHPQWKMDGLAHSLPVDPERQILLLVLRPQAFPPLQMQRRYPTTGPGAAQAARIDALTAPTD